jgi:hypothetical protein
MAITKPLKSGDKGAGFIAKAADTRPERWQRGRKTQITLSIAPDLLDQVDAVAHRRHLSRAALLTVWIGDALAKEAA